jgi:hypothetical protein
MNTDDKRAQIRALIESGDEDKTIKDLNLNVEDYKALVDALEYIKNLTNLHTLKIEINNAITMAIYSYCYIGEFENLYDAIGCILIKRSEMKHFDVLVRAGYFDVSPNMLHCVLDLNRNIASKVVSLTNPEVISNTIIEFTKNNVASKAVINRYLRI